MTRIKLAIGGQFVPAALHDIQSKEAGCLPGTRSRVLSMLIEWAKNDPMRFFIITGLAGTGKTSIAVTLCRRLQEDPDVQLGGSFFCSRIAPMDKRTDVRCILPTLAVALAERSRSFAMALIKELCADSLAAHKPVDIQMIALLQKPLIALSSLTGPILFVIDALDECEDKVEVAKLLQAISALTSDTKVKFILTSRPDTNTKSISSSCRDSILRLQTIDKAEVTADIRLYINDAISKRPLDEARCADSDLNMLVDRAGDSFIFASITISYILEPTSPTLRHERLQKVLSDSTTVAIRRLENVYESILTRASDPLAVDSDELEKTIQVLACILVARAPLSVGALAELLDRRVIELLDFLNRLHAVVHVPDKPDQPGLRTLHTSFGDYLLERANEQLRISKTAGHEAMARGCLLVMRKRLQFNVSQRRSSHEPNPSGKLHNVPLSLEYACLQWIYHILGPPLSSISSDEIEDTFKERFLFWLEVMSVLGQIQQAAAMLTLLAAKIQSTKLSPFLRDASAFVASSQEAITRSAPHIYLSALPFAAKDSLIYQTFAPVCTGLISVDAVGIDRHGGRLVMTLIGHTNAVRSVAYSPDGRLVSGSWDGTVRIWNINTDKEEIPPLCSDDGYVSSVAVAPTCNSFVSGTESGIVCIWNFRNTLKPVKRLLGHSKRVLSVAFSPDGRIIASASRDKSVNLWEAETGQNISVINGHTGEVRAVAFSPDGTILVSGSGDETIQFWDCPTGRPVRLPLKCCNEFAFCICFSPDGTKIAVGLSNPTVRLWGMNTDTNIAALRGHTGPICSVEFSRDGMMLLSASYDRSVRLWNLHPDGSEASSAVLTGHSSPVNSAKFSPDGLYIASAADDGTIRIWDARNDQRAVEPLQAHHKKVNSIAASAKGAIIVSGSDDLSVRVWDALIGEPKLPPLEGHNKRVLSVAITQEGNMIASASDDGTVRLWNAWTGVAASKPLQDHIGGVNAVKFSLDSLWLASGSADGTVRIWDVNTSSRLLNCEGWVSAVGFSPDCRFLAASGFQGGINFWDMISYQRVCESFRVDMPFFSIAFSPAGTHIGSTGNDNIGRIWDIQTGKQAFTLVGHTDCLCSITYSPDGRLIATGSDDNTVRLWDAVTGAQLALLCGHGSNVMSVAFTPDGYSIVSGSWDSTIRVWDVEAACRLSPNDDNDLVAALATSKLEDGWLLGPSGELLLWVPADYRNYIHVPPCRMLIAEHRVVLTAGKTWLHGDNWTACWRVTPSY